MPRQQSLQVIRQQMAAGKELISKLKQIFQPPHSALKHAGLRFITDCQIHHPLMMQGYVLAVQHKQEKLQSQLAAAKSAAFRVPENAKLFWLISYASTATGIQDSPQELSASTTRRR